MCSAKQDEMGRQDLRSEPKQLMTSSFDDGDDYDMHKSFREKSKGQKLFYYILMTRCLSFGFMFSNYWLLVARDYKDQM